MTWTAPNSSGGFHDEIKFHWELFVPSPKKVLLIGEGRDCAKHFRSYYPLWDEIVSANSDPSLMADITTDLCGRGWITPNYFDLVINQANLEHMYDPFGCCSEIANGLAIGGVHILHTHTVEAPYHGWPRDYFRFMADWFEDLPTRVSVPIETLWIWKKPLDHIFAAYRRYA